MKVGYKYTEKDAAKDTNASKNDVKSAWHDARDDAAKEGGWNVPSDRHGDGSGCFIATAAYGNYFESEVEILKIFRDTFLMKNFFGRLSVKIYYSISPCIAYKIRRSKILKKITRAILTPVVLILKILFSYEERC